MYLTWTRLVLLTTMLGCLAAEDPAHLDEDWRGIQSPSPQLDTRRLFHVVLETAGSGYRTDRILPMLRLAASIQDRDPASPTYGNFRTTYGAAAPTDPNVGVFCMECAAMTLESFSAALDDDAKTALLDLMSVAAVHIERYRVTDDYTNVYLLKAFVTIALSEIRMDVPGADRGYDMLDHWLAYTRAHGIHEFASPTYYGVELDAMALTRRYAQRERGRIAARSIESLIWSDIAANWYAPAEVISGAHSRDHDYLHGHGRSDLHLEMAGWLGRRSPDVESYPGTDSVFMALARSTPPAWVDDLRERVPRTVVAAWGSEPWQRRTQHVGRHVTLGTSGGSYCLEDKLLSAQLGTDVGTINACYVLDGRGDPYGQLAAANALSNQSVQHLTPLVLADQRGTEALFVVSERMPSDDAGFSALSCVASNILLPRQGSLWSGDVAIAMPGAGQRRELPRDQPVFLRIGDSALAVRVLHATSSDGDVDPRQVSLALVDDGQSYQACRLVCEHSASAPTGPVSAQIALHVAVAEGLDDAGFAAFRARFASTAYQIDASSGKLDVAADGGAGRMHVAMDTQRNVGLQAGDATDTPVLAVDGEDIGARAMSSSETEMSGSTVKNGHGCGIGSAAGFAIPLCLLLLRLRPARTHAAPSSRR